jgi:hypothetical protein
VEKGVWVLESVEVVVVGESANGGVTGQTYSTVCFYTSPFLPASANVFDGTKEAQKITCSALVRRLQIRVNKRP